MILETLDCSHICKFVGFYEDLFLNKTYLVLENAGEMNLADFVKEIRAKQTPLDEILVKSVMTQLFEATEYLHNN